MAFDGLYKACIYILAWNSNIFLSVLSCMYLSFDTIGSEKHLMLSATNLARLSSLSEWNCPFSSTSPCFDGNCQHFIRRESNSTLYGVYANNRFYFLSVKMLSPWWCYLLKNWYELFFCCVKMTASILEATFVDFFLEASKIRDWVVFRYISIYFSHSLLLLNLFFRRPTSHWACTPKCTPIPSADIFHSC